MQLENYQGKTLKFKTPSGYSVTIREQNGDDDDVLSLISEDSGEEVMINNINRFVLNIIVDQDITANRLTLQDIVELKLKDKHYIMLKSRIHSLGKEVKFKLACNNTKCGIRNAFVEDLSKYDNNFDKPTPEGEGYKYQIQPYESGKEKVREITLASTRKVRYNLFDGKAELYVLELSKGMISKNTELLARELNVWNGAEWVKVGNFGIFSPTEMAEIRNDLNKYDTQFIMAAECICPSCKNEMLVPFIQVKDFFFPSEITNK